MDNQQEKYGAGCMHPLFRRNNARRQGGTPGYRAPPNGCCAPITVSPNYKKMAVYIVHLDGASLKSHGAPNVLTTWRRAWM